MNCIMVNEYFPTYSGMWDLVFFNHSIDMGLTQGHDVHVLLDCEPLRFSGHVFIPFTVGKRKSDLSRVVDFRCSVEVIPRSWHW